MLLAQSERIKKRNQKEKKRKKEIYVLNGLSYRGCILSLFFESQRENFPFEEISLTIHLRVSGMFAAGGIGLGRGPESDEWAQFT